MKPVEPTRVAIDGIEYEFHHISVRKLNRLLLKIVKVVGEPLADSLDPKIAEVAKHDKEKAKELIDIGKIVKSLSESLQEDLVDEIIDGLLAGATCIGHGSVAQNFDVIFGGKLVHMWKVVVAAGKHYYGDFLQEGLGLLSK